MGVKRKVSENHDSDVGNDQLPKLCYIKPIDGNGDGGASGAMAAYFSSGFRPTGNSKSCNVDDKSSWHAYAHKERKGDVALVAKTKYNVDFTGTSMDMEHSSAIPCRYAIGVLDKNTGEIKLQPVLGQRVLRMEPRAHTLNYMSTSASPSKEASIAERRERNARLVEEFGSQRRKRQLAASRAAQVDATQVTGGESILGLVSTSGAKSKMDIIKEALSHRNIPPHNASGTTADEAYPWKKIIPGTVWDSLEIKKLFPAENKPEYRAELQRTGDFGKGYVLTRLNILKTEDKELRETRARALCLLGHLLKMYVDRRNSVLRVKQDETIATLAQKLRMDSSVCEGILDLFYSREESDDGGCRYAISKDQKHLMFGWILVLAIRAEPQSVLEPDVFKALLDEVKLKPQEVVAFYRELGCTAMRSSKSQGIGWRVALLPKVAEPKTLGESFPELKTGGRKPSK